MVVAAAKGCEAHELAKGERSAWIGIRLTRGVRTQRYKVSFAEAVGLAWLTREHNVFMCWFPSSPTHPARSSGSPQECTRPRHTPRTIDPGAAR